MDISTASELIERFVRGQFSQPSEAEQLLVSVFKACGYPVFEKGFVDSDEGVDCFIQTEMGGARQIIGVEVKAGTKPAGPESVGRAFKLKKTGPFNAVTSPHLIRHG